MSLKTAKYPKDLRVFVVPPGGRDEEDMFRDRGFRTVVNPNDADIMVWTGGADINPQLYGEMPLEGTNYNSERDRLEIGYWRIVAQNFKVFKVGICRGAQLLNVLNGGKLWQDVDNHALALGHTVLDVESGKRRRVSSTHHQQMRPANGAKIVALTHLSSKKQAEYAFWNNTSDASKSNSEATDYEVLWYPRTKSLCFQGHPEYTIPPETEEYFFELVRRYI